MVSPSRLLWRAYSLQKNLLRVPTAWVRTKFPSLQVWLQAQLSSPSIQRGITLLISLVGSPLDARDWITLCLSETAEGRVVPKASSVFFCLWSKVLFASCNISLTPAWPGGKRRVLAPCAVGRPWFVHLSTVRLCGWWLRANVGWPFWS